MTKIEGSGSESISLRHGSADPDPDPPQNVIDPQHWKKRISFEQIFAEREKCGPELGFF
jgi:hypothetical protein